MFTERTSTVARQSDLRRFIVLAMAAVLMTASTLTGRGEQIAFNHTGAGSGSGAIAGAGLDSSPDLTYGTDWGDFNTGTVNCLPSTGGNGLMLQTTAANGFLPVPGPSSFVRDAIALIFLPLLFAFRKRWSGWKTVGA